jgi:hypothetical protein
MCSPLALRAFLCSLSYSSRELIGGAHWLSSALAQCGSAPGSRYWIILHTGMGTMSQARLPTLACTVDIEERYVHEKDHRYVAQECRPQGPVPGEPGHASNPEDESRQRARVRNKPERRVYSYLPPYPLDVGHRSSPGRLWLADCHATCLWAGAEMRIGSRPQGNRLGKQEPSQSPWQKLA